MQLEIEKEVRRRDFHRFVLRTFPAFVDGWVYADLCNRLRRFMLDVRAGKSPRLIVCIPPRMGKSQICSVRFPLYCLLNNPTWEVIVASYGQSLVNRFSRFARALLESHPYLKSLWPSLGLAADHASVEEWQLHREGVATYLGGGTYRAVGRGSAITGTGADVLILDDLLKDFVEADSPIVRGALWDWYSSTARTRLAPGGGVLVIQTRWHPDDLVGRLLSEQKNNLEADQWEVVEYRALAEEPEKHRDVGESLLPARWSASELLKTKANMVARWWEALYQQRPISLGGNLFKTDAFKRYQAAPERSAFDSIIQVWDLRFGKTQTSGSFVCGWIIGKLGGSFYILDEARGRWSYAESRAQLCRLSEAWPEAVTKVVENKANGPAIESDLEGQVVGIILYNPRGDKFQRAERILPLVLAGNVYLPSDEAAPWAKDALAELAAFPKGSNDDRVDCLSMGLGYFLEMSAQMLEVYSL